MLNESKREDALGSGKSCYPSYANRLGPVALSSCPERPGCDWSSRLSTTGVTSGLSPEFDFRVTFGRSSLVYQPHIDLSREGDSTRVSRCHGRIRLASNGTFWLANFSKHPVFVDGNPVLTDEEVELKDLATVLIAHLAFRFDVNHLYVNALCHGTESSVLSSFRAHDESDSGLISADNVSHHSHGYGSSGGGHFGHPDNSHHHGRADSTGSSHNMLHSPPSVAQSEPSSDVSTKN
ncbi:hypothetical protein FGIG_06905 [Fasciola gigantica]|uniref:FHA domain-containing protein n=1 Tax=Fasciola gigantica TaxID=46835 RepID=A0A504YLJ8_FASGI|nr:hypothetical protein FGIG_06905 [Fasciola gigantica]